MIETHIKHNLIISLFDEVKSVVGSKCYDKNNNLVQIDIDLLNAKIAELEAAEPLRLLREERDRRLAATDWRATIDYPGDDQAAWLEYRQALRDITLQDPENVTWPEEPA